MLFLVPLETLRMANGHVGHESLHVCETLEEIRQAVRIG